MPTRPGPSHARRVRAGRGVPATPPRPAARRSGRESTSGWRAYPRCSLGHGWPGAWPRWEASTRASTRGEEAVAIAEKADHPYSRAVAAWGLGTLLRRTRRPRCARSPILEQGARRDAHGEHPDPVPVHRGAARRRLCPGRSGQRGRGAPRASDPPGPLHGPSGASLASGSPGSASPSCWAATSSEPASRRPRLSRSPSGRASAEVTRMPGGSSARSPGSASLPTCQAAISEHREALRLATALGMRPLPPGASSIWQRRTRRPARERKPGPSATPRSKPSLSWRCPAGSEAWTRTAPCRADRDQSTPRSRERSMPETGAPRAARGGPGAPARILRAARASGRP